MERHFLPLLVQPELQAVLISRAAVPASPAPSRHLPRGNTTRQQGGEREESHNVWVCVLGVSSAGGGGCETVRSQESSAEEFAETL